MRMIVVNGIAEFTCSTKTSRARSSLAAVAVPPSMASRTAPHGRSREKLMIAVALVFVVLGGAVTVSAVAAKPAYADGNGNGGGH